MKKRENDIFKVKDDFVFGKILISRTVTSLDEDDMVNLTIIFGESGYIVSEFNPIEAATSYIEYVYKMILNRRASKNREIVLYIGNLFTYRIIHHLVSYINHIEQKEDKAVSLWTNMQVLVDANLDATVVRLLKSELLSINNVFPSAIAETILQESKTSYQVDACPQTT